MNWLGKHRPLRRVKRLDLSNNNLGRDATNQLLAVGNWCPSETSAGLKPGSGWCPEDPPIVDTAGSMILLDLSDNGFTGEHELCLMMHCLLHTVAKFNALQLSIWQVDAWGDGHGSSLASPP